MLADYHVHSEFSDDSWYTVDDVCCDAVRLNLDEICFTDHVDYGASPMPTIPSLRGPAMANPRSTSTTRAISPQSSGHASAMRETLS